MSSEAVEMVPESNDGCPESAQDEWLEQKNRFAQHEAEQEKLAYQREMDEEKALGLVGAEPAPESGPMPVLPPQNIVGGVLKQKQRHGTLILEGVCTHCAHCGQPLTDSESVERGIGPICSKKGYFEEPKDPDEIQALIDLAEYQELVDFLSKHYKPQGARGMVNGLVRVCSLNRRSEVHQACTDAIESLGYKKLASLLRESLCVVEIRKSKHFPGSVEIWCKKSDYKPLFARSLWSLDGARFSRPHKATIVPLFKDGDAEKVPYIGWDYTTCKQDTHKRIVWNQLLKHYEGLFAKTDTGCVRVKRPKQK